MPPARKAEAKPVATAKPAATAKPVATAKPAEPAEPAVPAATPPPLTRGKISIVPAAGGERFTPAQQANVAKAFDRVGDLFEDWYGIRGCGDGKNLTVKPWPWGDANGYAAETGGTRVLVSSKTADANPDALFSTLLHECTHLVTYQAGIRFTKDPVQGGVKEGLSDLAELDGFDVIKPLAIPPVTCPATQRDNYTVAAVMLAAGSRIALAIHDPRSGKPPGYEIGQIRQLASAQLASTSRVVSDWGLVEVRQAFIEAAASYWKGLPAPPPGFPTPESYAMAVARGFQAVGIGPNPVAGTWSKPCPAAAKGKP